MKPVKQKLLIENDYNFFLFGISCPEKPCRLCYAMNRQLKASFSKIKDIEVQVQNQNSPLSFSVFAFRDEEMFTDYRIIVNRNQNKFLVPEFKQADYLLMVQGEMPYYERKNILKKIKEVPFVQTAFEIDVLKIKSKESFVF
jgi:hypothetical protein